MLPLCPAATDHGSFSSYFPRTANPNTCFPSQYDLQSSKSNAERGMRPNLECAYILKIARQVKQFSPVRKCSA